MTPNVAASIKARLLNKAKERGEEFEAVVDLGRRNGRVRRLDV